MFEKHTQERIPAIRFDKECIGKTVYDEDTILLEDVDIIRFMEPLWETKQVDQFMSEPAIWELLIIRYFKKEVADQMIELVANGANMKGAGDAQNSSED